MSNERLPARNGGLRPDLPASVDGVTELLFKVGSAFDSYTSQMRRGYSLNAHERLALSALWERGPMTMTDLGACIPLSRAAVTTLVDRLEDASLVRRSSDADDRRRTVVSITSNTLMRMLPLVSPWLEAANDLYQARTPEEWRVIESFLIDFRELNIAQAARLSEMSDEQLQELTQAITSSQQP